MSTPSGRVLAASREYRTALFDLLSQWDEERAFLPDHNPFDGDPIHPDGLAAIRRSLGWGRNADRQWVGPESKALASWLKAPALWTPYVDEVAVQRAEALDPAVWPSLSYEERNIALDALASDGLGWDDRIIPEGWDPRELGKIHDTIDQRRSRRSA